MYHRYVSSAIALLTKIDGYTNDCIAPILTRRH